MKNNKKIKKCYEFKTVEGLTFLQKKKSKTSKKLYYIMLKCRYSKEHLKRVFYRLLKKEYLTPDQILKIQGSK